MSILIVLKLEMRNTGWPSVRLIAHHYYFTENIVPLNRPNGILANHLATLEVYFLNANI